MQTSQTSKPQESLEFNLTSLLGRLGAYGPEKEKDASKATREWTQLIFLFHLISFQFIEIFCLGNSFLKKEIK